MEKLLASRLPAVCIVTTRKVVRALGHGEHVAHIGYLGGVTISAHHAAYYFEAAMFVCAVGHFIWLGWEKDD